MAHLVEAMAYVNEVPWHGLGNSLAANQSIEVWAQQAGMSFRILETPVQFQSGNAEELTSLQTFPDQKVLFRSDTKAALSVVSSRYQVVQPEEILEFYRDLTEISGFELESAGVLKEGRKIWALAKTGQSVRLKGSDDVNGYLLLATACDGSLATTAQFTSIRVVCNNTLAVALSNGQGAVKVPHSTNFDAKAVKQQLGISVSAWDIFSYQMKLLSERPVKSRESIAFIEKLFATDSASNNGIANERAMKKVLALYEGHGKGAELASAKGTAFGLLNAITDYVDHERRARSNDHRLESAWFGQGAILKQRALNQTLLMLA